MFFTTIRLKHVYLNKFIMLQGEPLSQAFASSDIFLMASDSETLGFVVLEAMASGLPVVASAAGGLIDIVNHEHTGFLAENNDDMKEFVECTRLLVNNIELRHKMASSARLYAEGLSWEAATSKLRNLQYRNAIRLHKERNAVDTNGEADNEDLGFIDKLYRPDLAL